METRYGESEQRGKAGHKLLKNAKRNTEENSWREEVSGSIIDGRMKPIQKKDRKLYLRLDKER